MKDSDWAILHELHKNPSMTKVAGLFYMTQPSLTKRIKHMEAEFQVKIVERTSHGLKFTKEGEYLAVQAEEVLALNDKIRKGLVELTKEEQSSLKLGAAYTYMQHELPNTLLDFTRKNPGIRLNVMDAPSDAVLRKLLEGSIDAGFIRGDYEAEISKILVEKDQAYLVTKEPVELCELPHMERISYRSNNRTVALLENWWKEWFDQKSSTGSTVGYLDLALQLVDREEGYTICFLPKDYQNEKNLCLTPLYLRDGTPVLRNTWFIYPEKAQKNNALNTFIAYVRENIAVEQ